MTPTPDQKARTAPSQYLSGDARSDQKASAEYLRSAQPRLICRVDIEEGREDRRSKLTPYISEVERGWDEIISEGYDPDHSPLGCPVYWRSLTEVTSGSIAVPFRRSAIKSSRLGERGALPIAIPSQVWRSHGSKRTSKRSSGRLNGRMQELNAAYDALTERAQKASGEKTKKHCHRGKPAPTRRPEQCGAAPRLRASAMMSCSTPSNDARRQRDRHRELWATIETPEAFGYQVKPAMNEN